MRILIIANSQKDWPFRIPDADVVDAWSYLTQPHFSELRGVKVFNLCRSYRYQTVGYYVSLLAEARGHKPLPSITTLQDLRSQAMMRLGLRGARRPDPAQPRPDPVGAVHAQHLFRPQPGQALRTAEPAPLQPVPVAAPAGAVQAVQEVADPQRGHDRRQRRPRGALALRRRSRPAVLRGPPRRRRRNGPARGTTWRSCTTPRSRSPPPNEDALKRFIKAAENLEVRAELITPRRLRADRRVRRPLHPRNDGRQPSHLSLCPPGFGRRPDRDRRSAVDRPLHE